MYVYVCIYIYYLSIYVYVSACSSSLLTSRTAVTCSMLYTQQYLFTVVINKLLSIQCDTNVSQLVCRVIPGSYCSLMNLLHLLFGELSSSSLNRLSVCLLCLFWLCIPPVVYGRHILSLLFLRVVLFSDIISSWGISFVVKKVRVGNVVSLTSTGPPVWSWYNSLYTLLSLGRPSCRQKSSWEGQPTRELWPIGTWNSTSSLVLTFSNGLTRRVFLLNTSTVSRPCILSYSSLSFNSLTICVRRSTWSPNGFCNFTWLVSVAPDSPRYCCRQRLGGL